MIAKFILNAKLWLGCAAFFAISMATSCSTAPGGSSSAAKLFLNTTTSGRKFYDIQPLRSGESVVWKGGVDDQGFCNGEGTEYHFTFTGDSSENYNWDHNWSHDNGVTYHHIWKGSYEHGRAQGRSVAIDMDSATKREITYQQGRIVSMADPAPVNTSVVDPAMAMYYGEISTMAEREVERRSYDTIGSLDPFDGLFD
ncbi:MAG: hypothetical protein U1F81_03245 [Verrucomicrobiaceae bacterium]